MLDSTVYKIISLNVRGLKNQRKRRSIFSYLKDQKCHCYFLQETYSEPKDELIWKSEWGGEMLFSHGTNRQKGVCILLNLSACNLSIESQFSDVDGRIVLANISFNSTKVSLCNIYAPNKLDLQLRFISTLNGFLCSNANISELILGGDWNVTLEAIDKSGGIPWRPTAYRDQVLALSREFELVDILRVKNPNGKFYTYESKALKLKSRIDYFLITKSWGHFVSVADIKISIAPDHRAVRLGLKMAINKRGPGLWKFNNSLLKDQVFLTLIENSYPMIKVKYSEVEDARLRWELIKMELRGIIIPFAKNKARATRLYIENLEKQLAELDFTILSHTGSQMDLFFKQSELEKLKKELQHSYDKKGEGAIFRSKLRWTEQGEKPTKYFFNLEAKHFMQKTIVELKISDNKTVIKDGEILQQIEDFYRDLYTSQFSGSEELFDNFVGNVVLPQLSEVDKNMLEGELTVEECRQILKTFSNGKSPGEDGFTVEFYVQFFELLAPDMLASLNAAYLHGEMSVSQRRGVITLIPKDDSNLLELSNWRPITLLNVDYKIASKAIASRIKNVLPALIHSDQSGFMKDRFIGQNIRLINDILVQTELQDVPGILLQLDFRKAFDTVEWPVIQQTLSKFNFGDSLKRWVQTFYCNAESSILNNGLITKQIPVSRGVRQGCPLSPYLFILVAEILASKIRHDKNVQGIELFKKEIKLSQFADDTSLICKNLKSVGNALNILADFGAISGLHLNKSKTKALWLGPWRSNRGRPLGLAWTNEPVRVLGTFISYDSAGNERKNFAKKVDNLKTKLAAWRTRKLSLFGRCLISKTLGLSQIVYSASMLDIPSNYASVIQSLLFQFLWKNKPDKIKRQVLYQDYCDGGLRVTNVEIMFKSLRLAWIQRLLKSNDEEENSWSTIPNFYFNKYGGLNFLLRSNYDKKFLNDSDIPSFYKDILFSFLDLKSLYDSKDEQEMILFNNKDILIDGTTIFYQDWVENGVFTLHDVIDVSGHFLPFEQFQHRYGIKCNFLTYFQVISAIPSALRKKAKERAKPNVNFLSGGTFFQLTPVLTIDLLKLRSKDYYWLFLNKRKPQATGPMKWDRDFVPTALPWHQIFDRVKVICKENQLREFYFKLIHRIVATKKELALYGIKDNNICFYCGEPDSVLHTFQNCRTTTSFHNQLLNWFNGMHNTSISPANYELLFGMPCGKDNDILRKLNFCLLFANYYLHYQKVNGKNLDWAKFTSKINYKLRIENEVSGSLL